MHHLKPPDWLPERKLEDEYLERTIFLKNEKTISPDEAKFILWLGKSASRAIKNQPAGDLGLIHGDLHTGNVLRKQGLLLIDWEGAGIGPRAIDWSSILQRTRYFSLPLKEFKDFQAAYEEKITPSPLIEAMIKLRIANSITHLLLGDERRKNEGRLRLQDMMSGKENASWRDI